MLRQQGNIVRPLAQRRQGQGNHVQPVIEILPEVPGIHFPRQIAIGGRDDPHIHGLSPVAAHAEHLPLLNHPQQLDLHGQGHFPYFIQKNRAAVRLEKMPLVFFVRAGERALLVPEEFRGQQRLCEGRAVHCHKGSLRPAAGRVHGPGHQLLARARLAGDQHRGVRGRNGADHLPESGHGRAAPHHVRTGLGGGQAAGEGGVFLDQAHMGEYIAQDDLELFKVQRLGQIVVCAGLDGFHSRRHV